MLCVEIMKQEGKITPAEWNFFLRGAAGMDKTRPTKPDVPFLNNVKVWNNAFDLNETIPIFKGIHNDLTKTPCWVKLGNDEVWTENWCVTIACIDNNTCIDILCTGKFPINFENSSEQIDYFRYYDLNKANCILFLFLENDISD